MDKIGSTPHTFGVLTLSDKGARGERVDTSGPMLCELLRGDGYVQARYAVLPDRREDIVRCLRQWTDAERIALILTTGGTGLAPTDVTPEATLEVIERQVPGIAEVMRQASLRQTIHAVLSRGVAGIRGSSLIINLPGSEKAARENILVVLPALRHALDKLRGDTTDCGTVGTSRTAQGA